MRSPIRPLLAAAAALCALALHADQIGTATLNISGRNLTIPQEAFTGVDIPGVVQTKLGNLTDDAAQPGDLQALADLTGPGLAAPIPLSTKPGSKFLLPPLHEKGDYLLQNVRLADKDGNFLAPASPAAAVVHVTGTLEPSVTITQLTADDLRARGISIDLRNYDVYDFTYTFAINNVSVDVPYPVIVDKRTHEIVQVPGMDSFTLPKPQQQTPPRWDPPSIAPFALDDDAPEGCCDQPGSALDPEKNRNGRHPSIPAAIVIPNGFGVLHQFFAVILNVRNAAPEASQIVLDNVTATISTPTGLRVVKVNPGVALGTPVPVRVPGTNDTIIIANATASADWSLEALRSGTHTVDFDIRATYKQQGQTDVALHGHASAALVVTDPRFQINFVHPDTVRKDEPYTAYAFITNVSPQKQTVSLDRHQIPVCVPNGGFDNHVCIADTNAALSLSFDAGETIAVPYKLTPDLTGHVYAGVADTTNAIEGSVTLVMGVSAEGVPLSPATLVMPYHTQFVNQAFVDACMPLLGLGYSLAVAPVTPKTATLPHLIKTDVWTRAQNIARAGERIFVTRSALAADDPEEDRAPVFNLALDLLGNVEQAGKLSSTADMHEWDQLRMLSADGRQAGAALGVELARVGLANGRSMSDFASDFAAATSHRSPYLFALVHGDAGGTYALSVSGSSTSMLLTADNTKTAVRTLPFGELMKLPSTSESGQLALVGRWSDTLLLDVLPSTDSFKVDLIYPDTADGALLKTSFTVSASAGLPVRIRVERGNKLVIVTGGNANPQPDSVAQTPLALVHAAQDLHLDPGGHIVTLLFNRPVTVADAGALRNNFELRTVIAAANKSYVRKNDPNDPTTLYIPGAALQDDARMLNVSFDHSLSTNAAYTINAGPMTDALTSAVLASSSVVPRIDNAGRGGIVLGKLLTGEGAAIKKNVVSLLANNVVQYDTTYDNGEFFYEFVPRDVDLSISGAYHLEALVGAKRATLDGVIRQQGQVQNVVLQFLGRGSARGTVTYSDGTAVANAGVIAASPFAKFEDQFHGTQTKDDGTFSLDDLPVGPLTFSTADAKGNTTYASAEIRQPGEVVTQNLVIQKRDTSGFGTVRITIRRNDQKDSAGNYLVVPHAHVGVWQSGAGLADGYTDSAGQFTFSRVPAGGIQILAADFSISPESISFPFTLAPDQVLDETLMLNVPDADALKQSCTVIGHVKRDNPTSPGTGFVLVPGAQVRIGNLAPVVTEADGSFVYANVPVSLQNQNVIQVYDPATTRKGLFRLPSQLTAGTDNTVEIEMVTNQPQGYAKFVVHLTSVSGEPIDNYRVMWPGYPPIMFSHAGEQPGDYSLTMPVPVGMDVWAVPNGTDAKYGDQTAHVSMHAEFNDQRVVAELRLPGQGTVNGKIEQLKRCDGTDPQCVPGYNLAYGKGTISYMKWDEADQGLSSQERTPIESDPASKLLVFDKVPVGSFAVETVDMPDGYAKAAAVVKYEGDLETVELPMAALLSVSGRVLNYDLQTPVPNATVYYHGHVELTTHTKADGSYIFDSVPQQDHYRIEADGMLNGIRRRGYVDGTTPQGNNVAGLLVIAREQANVTGSVVDGSGNAVPLARYWARELAWPYTEFGTKAQPLFTGQDGHFAINNVFSGAVRITAEMPNDDAVRADAQVVIDHEGDDQSGVQLKLDAGAVGSVKVVVVDSETGSTRVPYAEVTLLQHGQAFDFGITNADGEVTFNDVPVKGFGFDPVDYNARATSKALGRAGSTTTDTKLSADALATLTVALSLTGGMSGTLTDADLDPAAPVAGATIQLGAEAFLDKTSTGSAGEFAFHGIPEGTYHMSTLDVATGRIATPPNDLTISKLKPNIPDIRLVLEKTGTLTVNAYLPDDHGVSSNTLVPLADVHVQNNPYEPTIRYDREAQQVGQPLTFAHLVTRTLSAYLVTVRELGGENRSVTIPYRFPAGVLNATLDVVLPTTGTVRVEVKDGSGQPVPGAFVRLASSGGGNASVYTDSDGSKTISGLGLGDVAVTASANGFTSTASAKLDSHSTTLVVPVVLSGTRVTLSGHVTAETGGPSAATRVIVDVGGSSTFSSVHIDSVTDANGDYKFEGMPAGGNNATLHFYGPDGVTVGAAVTVPLPGGPLVNDVTLDGTPPQVTAVDPANNANSVAPNAHIFVTFSEPLKSVDRSSFKLVASDDAGVVSLDARATTNAKGEFQAEVIPATQLRSNVVYVFTIVRGLADLTGNAIAADALTTFRTVDYTEPKIIHVLPPVSQPIDQGVLFQFQFNKAVSLDSFANGGFVRMEQLTGPGGSVTGDPIVLSTPRYAQTPSGADDPSTIAVAPQGTQIPKGKFYRLTMGGIRDTAVPFNTQKDPQPFEWRSVDDVKPVAAIVSPVPAGQPLIVNNDYVINVGITDEGTSTASQDVQWVDWISSDGTTDTTVAHLSKAPYAYTLKVLPGMTKIILRAQVTDLSENRSDLTNPASTYTWDVVANQPPQNVVVAPSKTSVYRNTRVDGTVSFTDEGLTATVHLSAVAKKADGSDYPLPASVFTAANPEVTRASTAVAWPPASFGLTLPADVAEGQPVVISAYVTDSQTQNSAVATATVNVLIDTTAPAVTITSPKAETAYTFADGVSNTFPIVAKAVDNESGVASVSATYDGNALPLVYDAASQTWKGTGNVRAMTTDTRVHVTVTATDYHGNATPSTVDVIFKGVTNANASVVQWVTPLDGAVLKAGDKIALKLRARVIDHGGLQAVSFSSSAFAAAPPSIPNTGNADAVYEATVDDFVVPSTPFVITAKTIDAVVANQVQVPITVEPVVFDAAGGDKEILVDKSVEESDIAGFSGKSILVRGPGVHLYFKKPIVLKNLLVLEGAQVGNGSETKLDVTVTDHLYVDGDSSIDVSGKGYLGAHQTSEDGLFTQGIDGASASGIAGASGGASGSYGGIGADNGGRPNAAYGSIANPTDFGSGGSTTSTDSRCTGGHGGGVVILHGGVTATDTGRLVVAGGVRADGENADCGVAGSGSGGSVNIIARAVVTGASTRITANGADSARGGNIGVSSGGGRVAVTATERLDLYDAASELQARGGRNNDGASASQPEGGAGTVYLSKPGATLGELRISAYDDRYPASTRVVRSTPLSTAFGTLSFDALTVGPRALVRLDNDLDPATPRTVDGTAVVVAPADVPTLSMTTVPAAGSSVIQGTGIATTVDATSVAGVNNVTFVFSAGTAPPVSFASTWPSHGTNAASPATIVVPGTTAIGAVTLKAVTTDRAGRSAESTVATFTVAPNFAPSIAAFDVTPSPVYVGNTLSVAVSATDDVAVKTLSLTSQIGSGSPSTQTFTANAASASHTFSVAIPRNAIYEGATVTLTASADDGTAAPVTQTKTIAIAHDGIKPVVTISEPNSGTAAYVVDSGAKIHVVATAVDAESGVSAINVLLEGGSLVPATMTATANPNEYSADLPIPIVSGSTTVSRNVTVTATDVLGNARAAVAAVQITPHYDPTAPIVTFICGTDGALVAAGSQITLSVTALPGSSGTSVSGVTFSDGTTTLTGSANGSVYSVPYTVPAGTAPGTLIAILATAKTNGQGSGKQQAQLVVSAFDSTISSDTTISATDTAYDGKDVLVTGGKLTISGAHAFGKLSILNGATVIPTTSDALTMTTLYVACGASIDASSYSGRAPVGFARNTAYPGAAAPAFDGGGGHIGRGGVYTSPPQFGTPGGTYGSIYRPLEAGGGGLVRDPAFDGGAGGGVIRISAATAIVDGALLANGQDAVNYGIGAGGSVWLTAGILGGGGSIQASGAVWKSGTNDSGAGGGGAVAVEYAQGGGPILANLAAVGGASSYQAAAGSAYVFGPQSIYGDLTVNNGTRSSSLPSSVITELPSFGAATVLSTPAAGAATLDAMWQGTYFAGHWLQVTASDGTPRGKWRIASVANDASVRTINGFLNVPAQSAAYDGYLMYSDAGHPAGTHVVAVRNNAGQWQYDNGSAFADFTPQTGDVLFASFSATASQITALQTFTCPNAVCPAVSGLPTAAVVRGEVAMNAASGTHSIPSGASSQTGSIVAANHGFFIHPDNDVRGFVLSGGPVTVTLESGADVRTGDALRGLYRFDSVTIKNARVYTADLVESTSAARVDGNSTFVSGNAGAPVVDTAQINYVAGAAGPAVRGLAGAVRDDAAGGTIEVYVRNGSRTATPLAFPTNSDVTFGTKGGFSIQKVPNGASGAYAVSSAGSSTYAYVEARASQTNKHLDLALTATATGGNEFDWVIFEDGTCQVSVNGSAIGSKFGYTTNTLFRIERTPANVNFYLDGQLKQSANADSRPRYAYVTFRDEPAELNSIDFGFDTPSRFSAIAASDGSFTVPVQGIAGDALSITARDRHVYPMASAPQSLSTIPAGVVIAAPALSPNPVTGGHSVTGTITLGSAAPTGGVTIPLSSSSSSATVPASVTIAANAASATFTITTAVVSAPATATVTATYGGVAYTTALSIVPDSVPPSITVTSPAANAHFIEGSGQIAVQATVTDADAGVQSVVAALDGTNYTLTAANGSSVYSKTIAAPFVDGTAAVAKQITITATDKAGNPSTASVPIFIDAVTDTAPPNVTWSCYTNGAMFPANYAVKLDVTVPPVSSQNVIQSVVFQFDDGSSLPAQPIGGNVYEAAWTTPSSPKSSTVTAVATAAGGGVRSVPITAAIVTADLLLTNSSSIAATDTSMDGKAVAVSGSTTVVTIDGVHNFSKLMVLAGATVVETSGVTNPLILGTTTPTDIYIACGSAIDVTIKGYGADTTYPGAAAPNSLNGGSHIGVGGVNSGATGSTYGSVYFPAEAGSGAGGGGMGGGVVRINAGTLTVDGSIKANGNASDTFNNVGAAGGSLWIATGTLAGSGAIQALGGNTGSWGTGGGGAISLTYSTLGSGSILSNLLARTGTGSSRGELGGAGSIWVHGPNNTYGDLTIDNSGIVGQPAVLPSLGSGFAAPGSGGATLITDRALDIPSYFKGHWIEVRDTAGTLRGTWRISGIDPTNRKQVTLAPNGSETIDVQAGDKWQGVYRFDTIFAPNGDSFTSADPIRLGDAGGVVNLTGPTAAGKTLALADPIDAASVTVLAGNVGATSITAPAVTVKNGAVLSASATTLTVKATDVTIENGGSIDTSAKGYPQNVSYPGATVPANLNGGSHIGIGGVNSGTAGSTYGSVYFPAEAGSGAGNGGMGGGVVRLDASGTLRNDGSIKADGNAYETFNNIGGAAGSIYITASTLTGSGSISAKGGDTGSWGTGGGGAISINYSAFGSGTMLSNVTARAGVRSSRSEFGGAGSIYVKGPSATLGTLTVDYGGVSGKPTELPSLGYGTAQSGSSGATLVTGLASDIPIYFKGHWVEVSDASGTVKGIGRITDIPAPRTVTLTPDGAAFTIQPGDGWRGVYRFDSVTVNGATLQSGDRIDGTATFTNGGKTIFNNARPAWDPAKVAQIVITPTTTGNANIVAPAGTIADSDTPITVVATKSGTTQTASVTAANGGFTIPVSGASPDSFVLVATDTHAYPLSSLPITVSSWPAPVNVMGVSVSPASLNGGETATGTVTLSAAPAVSVTVALSSSASGVAAVPASVSVAAGQTTATFTVTTANPAVDTNATITATLGSSQATAAIAVKSVAVAVQLVPASVNGGATSTLTVTLSAAAATAATIPLTTSNGAVVPVPATLTIAAGATSASTVLTTNTVQSTTNVAITATYGAATGNATLTVTTGAATTVAMSTYTNDPAFAAERVAMEGRTMAVYGSASDKVVLLDTSSSTPALIRVVSLGGGLPSEVVLRGGWAYVATKNGGFGTFSTTASSPAINNLNFSSYQPGTSLALLNNAAFMGTDGYGIAVYDVTDPVHPRVVVNENPGGSYGSTKFPALFTAANGRYIYGVATNGSGSSLVVFDAKDPSPYGITVNGWTVARTNAISGLDAQRGAVNGNTLYLSGAQGIVPVDITDPAAPAVGTLTALSAGGIDTSGSNLYAAGGTALTPLSASNRLTPVAGTPVPIPTAAKDVRVAGGTAYVAAGANLAIVSTGGAPVVTPSLVSVGAIVGGNVTVTGAAGAVTGTGSVTVFVDGATTASAAAAANGSFSVTLPATIGDSLAVRAGDGSGKPSSSYAIGAAGFGPSAAAVDVVAAGGAARAVVREGNTIAVYAPNVRNTPVSYYDVSNPASPQLLSQSTGSSVSGYKKVVLVGGTKYEAGASNLFVNGTQGRGVSSYNSFAADGRFAFGGDSNGSIDALDLVLTPAGQWLTSFPRIGTVSSNINITDIVLIGSRYLAAVSPSRAGNAGHDLVIFDRTNVYDAVKLQDLDIGGAAFNAQKARLAGNILYLFGADGGAAVVDVTDPANPVVTQVVTAEALTSGDANGSVLAAGAGFGGVKIANLADPAHPRSGVQAAGDVGYDALFGKNALFVAGEHQLLSFPYAGAPVISPTLVSISTSGGTATVTGSAGAVLGGSGAVALELRNGTNTAAGTANADGSFTAAIPATFGTEVTLEATDAAGRSSAPAFVGMPYGPAMTVDASKITFNYDGTLSIAGAAGAVTGGTQPIGAIVLDASTPTTRFASNVALDAGGAFTSALANFNGDPVGVVFRDASGRTTDLVNAGVPLTLGGNRLFLRNQSGALTLEVPFAYVAGKFPVTLTILDQRSNETQSVNLPSNADTLVPFSTIHAQVGDAISLSAVDARGSHASLQSVATVPPPVVIDASKITVAFGSAKGTAGAITGGPGLQVSGTVGTNFFAASVLTDGSFSTSASGTEGAAVTLTARDNNTSSTTVNLPAYTNIHVNLDLTTSTVNGAVVTDSASVAGTVTLTSASSSASTITLTSSNPSVVQVPATVTIAAFSQAQTFSIHTANPASDTAVTITATRGAASATAVMTVKKVSMSIDPASQTTLFGGSSTTAYVNLNPAPTVVAVVNLTASNLTLPNGSQVTVSPNQTLASFSVNVPSPPSPTTGSITATWAGSSVTNTYPIQPVAGLTIDTAKIHFGQSGDRYTLYGTAGAIAGGAPPVYLNVIAQYNTYNQFSNPVNADGSFNVTLRAPSGVSISIQALDSASPQHTAGPTAIGNVPDPFSATADAFIIHNDAGAISVGNSFATPITGASPISLQFTNARSGVVTTSSIASNSTFSVPIPGAAAGDALTVTVVDALGNRADNLSIGTVLATATVTSVPVTTAMADAAFRSRIVSFDAATKTLAVASRPNDNDGTGASDKIVLFDLTNPAAPAYRSTIALGAPAGAVNGIWTANGWLYAVTDSEFATADLHTSPPTVHVSADAPVAQSASVAVQGTWAVVAGRSGFSGEYDLFDVRDPATPQLFSATQNGPGSRVTSLMPWRPWLLMQGTTGSNYVVSTDDALFVGLYWFPVSGMNGWAAVDDRVFGVGHGSIVAADFDEWVNPQNVIYSRTAANANAIDIAGATAVVADDTAGVSLVDLSTPLSPAYLQAYGINATALDLKIANNVVYVAAETGLKVVSGLPLAPAVDNRQVVTTGDGATAAAVTGSAGAVTGQAPVTATLTTSAGGPASGIAVAAAGTFGPTPLVTPPGAGVTLSATDAAARQTTRQVGVVPFTIAEDAFHLTQDVADDPNATMRRLAVDGTHLYAASGYPEDSTGESDEIFVFDTTQPLAEQAYPDVLHAGDTVQNFVVSNGWAYVAGGTSFSTVNLSTANSFNFGDHTPKGVNAVAVIGHYAFIGAPGPDDGWTAGLQIYDITDPAHAVWVREVPGILDAGDTWGIDGLKPLGANRLLVFLPATGIKIFDVTDVQNLTLVGRTDFRRGMDGTLDGNTLYVTGDYDGVRIVDLTNPAAPALLSFVDSLGPSSGVAVVRPNLIAVATGIAGLTFVDVSDRTNPVIKGTQQVGGSPMDIRVVGKTIYTAGELVLDSLKLP